MAKRKRYTRGELHNFRGQLVRVLTVDQWGQDELRVVYRTSRGTEEAYIGSPKEYDEDFQPVYEDLQVQVQVTPLTEQVHCDQQLSASWLAQELLERAVELEPYRTGVRVEGDQVQLSYELTAGQLCPLTEGLIYSLDGIAKAGDVVKRSYVTCYVYRQPNYTIDGTHRLYGGINHYVIEFEREGLTSAMLSTEVSTSDKDVPYLKAITADLDQLTPYIVSEDKCCSLELPLDVFAEYLRTVPPTPEPADLFEADDEQQTVKLELTGKPHVVNTVLTYLRTLEAMGNQGTSRDVHLHWDGDGSDRFDLKVDGQLDPSIEKSVEASMAYEKDNGKDLRVSYEGLPD